MYATSCPMIFLGNSDGVGALYDCFRRITLLQNLPFSSISRQCCKTVSQKKILSAAWLHYQSEGPVVYYSLDTHIVVWKVKKNEVKILHDNDQNCQNSRFNSGQLQIACLSSLPAECCTPSSSNDKNEHKLAIGYMGGKIVIIGFDPMTGNQTTSLTIFAENGHNDDICSLSFSSYSLSSHQSYRQGLLCSVSRDSVLKVWSCSNQNEIAEHRILPNYHGSNQKTSGSQTNTTNWFTAGFLPRSCIKSSNVAYEIVSTNSSGDLLTFTLPEKGLNSKLRISKTQRTFQSKMMNKNQPINHTFIIFSIAMDLEHKIAITNSLDYKLILWNLSTRTSETVFYSFSNGALAIDCCQSDKRIAVAFGSNVFVLDFIRESTTNDDDDVDANNHYDIHVQRLPLSSKTRFFNVIWNRKYFERLGRLIIGTLDGEIIHYDLNSKEIIFKSTKVNVRDTSKIYSIVWLDTLFLSQPDENQNEQQSSPVVLTLHQSGKIMVNYLSNNNMQENFEKYLIGVPENQKIKRTALLTSDDQKYLLMGNDDGTVDVFRRIVEMMIDRKAFQHLYRFRSFNRPCLSIEYCSRTNHLAITALHENYINCYRLDDLDNDNESSSNIDGEDDDSKLFVKTVPVKCRLQGHEDRVSFTCWSPFNRIDELDERILLASASYDTTCIIWNIAKQIPLKRFFCHKSLIYSIK
ncbi:hypothetical protein BLA29_001673, partial [Euroglyphus maynei]